MSDSIISRYGRFTIIILNLLIFNHFGLSQPYEKVNNIDDFRSEYFKSTAKISSILCDFEQEKHLDLMEDILTSSGKFFYEKERKFRIEYEEPFEYLIVFNGERILIKEGEKKKNLNYKSRMIFKRINEIIFSCVEGNILNDSNYGIKVFENAKEYKIVLTPNSEDEKKYLMSLSLIVNKMDFTLDQLTMIEEGGDNTTLYFLNKQLNEEVADSVFNVYD